MGKILLSAWQHCDWAGKLDLVVLGILSVISWWIMIEKYLLMRRIHQRQKNFEDTLADQKIPDILPSPIHQVFLFGRNLVQKETWSEEKLVVHLEKVAVRELETIGQNLSFLAAIATVAPFLGLLGTVWGLLIAFHNMYITGSSSIKVVASGVAEALVTTVIGLVVAIPAAVGYSYFTESLKKLGTRIDALLPELAEIIIGK
ncbi:MAG: MotA/TolQ/ExbB proton channel family protein [Candidatus Omnitrophica bacterium]|nr:MotA/TolQ/ExbB proton channel family protein [Candidatus Omnitrophota bacterium]